MFLCLGIFRWVLFWVFWFFLMLHKVCCWAQVNSSIQSFHCSAQKSVVPPLHFLFVKILVLFRYNFFGYPRHFYDHYFRVNSKPFIYVHSFRISIWDLFCHCLWAIFFRFLHVSHSFLLGLTYLLKNTLPFTFFTAYFFQG